MAQGTGWQRPRCARVDFMKIQAVFCGWASAAERLTLSPSEWDLSPPPRVTHAEEAEARHREEQHDDADDHHRRARRHPGPSYCPRYLLGGRGRRICACGPSSWEEARGDGSQQGSTRDSSCEEEGRRKP